MHPVGAPVGQVALEDEALAARRPHRAGITPERLSRRRHGQAPQAGAVGADRVDARQVAAQPAQVAAEGDPARGDGAARAGRRAQEKCDEHGEEQTGHQSSLRRTRMGRFLAMRGSGRYVYGFDEPSEGGRELLGGKGIGLAEMTQLGVPVPSGFTITTDACRAYMANGQQLPDGLPEEIEQHIDALQEKAGKRFGDSRDPLLVSVRSGAAVSMPGMMDTILNLGLNDDAVEGLASSTGNPRFAYDSYRRLIQMYGEVVEGVDAHRFEQALADLKNARGVQQDVELDADDLRELVGTFKAICEEDAGSAFPQDAREQLTRAVRAVFESWDTPRAQVYRRAHRIPDDLGTAVNVVQMVFGNKGERSGTGVAFTRDPSTGESGVFGEFLANAQGEDVVAGIRTPQPLEAMRDAMPEAFDEFLENVRRLEEHYRDMQDVEFTVEDGKLYLLQTRAAKRTAAAALKAAAAMVEEGLISREEAVNRIDPAQLDQLLHPMIDPSAQLEVAATGLNASPGAASGGI